MMDLLEDLARTVFLAMFGLVGIGALSALAFWPLYVAELATR